jgi:hypothetical protein
VAETRNVFIGHVRMGDHVLRKVKDLRTPKGMGFRDSISAETEQTLDGVPSAKDQRQRHRARLRGIGPRALAA